MIQESRTLVARKSVRLVLAALSLILTAGHSQAHLGWTLEQFKQQYGQPVLAQEQIAGRIGYVFTGGDYLVAAFFHDTQVSRILYIRRTLKCSRPKRTDFCLSEGRLMPWILSDG